VVSDSPRRSGKRCAVYREQSNAVAAAAVKPCSRLQVDLKTSKRSAKPPPASTPAFPRPGHVAGRSRPVPRRIASVPVGALSTSGEKRRLAEPGSQFNVITLSRSRNAFLSRCLCRRFAVVSTKPIAKCSISSGRRSPDCPPWCSGGSRQGVAATSAARQHLSALRLRSLGPAMKTRHAQGDVVVAPMTVRHDGAERRPRGRTRRPQCKRLTAGSRWQRPFANASVSNVAEASQLFWKAARALPISLNAVYLSHSSRHLRHRDTVEP
jgi:hypothetical protein